MTTNPPSTTHPPGPENRLARETSPYLLQHKHNPVAWWAWGPDALAEAQASGKPILLATGYSAAAQSVSTDFPILRKPYQMQELSRALAEILSAEGETPTPHRAQKSPA
jgi:hypothetical protein